MARAPRQYAGATQEAVRQFKYRARWRIGQWFAREMAGMARSTFPVDEIDLVVPVPSHWVKNRLRGFNSPGYLARAVAKAIDRPYVPGALRRTRWTSTQTRLSWTIRFRNVNGAFEAKRRLVADRTVLLIDDVLTSGATAHACALALQEADARWVLVLTAAKTAAHAL